MKYFLIFLATLPLVSTAQVARELPQLPPSASELMESSKPTGESTLAREVNDLKIELATTQQTLAKVSQTKEMEKIELQTDANALRTQIITLEGINSRNEQLLNVYRDYGKELLAAQETLKAYAEKEAQWLAAMGDGRLVAGNNVTSKALAEKLEKDAKTKELEVQSLNKIKGELEEIVSKQATELTALHTKLQSLERSKVEQEKQVASINNDKNKLDVSNKALQEAKEREVKLVAEITKLKSNLSENGTTVKIAIENEAKLRAQNKELQTAVKVASESETQLRNQNNELRKSRDTIQALLTSESVKWEALSKELTAMGAAFKNYKASTEDVIKAQEELITKLKPTLVSK